MGKVGLHDVSGAAADDILDPQAKAAYGTAPAAAHLHHAVRTGSSCCYRR
jgi:hypothetical protein